MTPSLGLKNWKDREVSIYEDVKEYKSGRGKREFGLGQVQFEKLIKYISPSVNVGSSLEFQR